MSNQNLTEKKDDNFVFVSTLFWMNKERQLRNDIDCHVSLQAPNLEERKGEEYPLSCPSYLQELCLTLTPIELLSLVSRCEIVSRPLSTICRSTLVFIPTVIGSWGRYVFCCNLFFRVSVKGLYEQSRIELSKVPDRQIYWKVSF